MPKLPFILVAKEFSFEPADAVHASLANSNAGGSTERSSGRKRRDLESDYITLGRTAGLESLSRNRSRSAPFSSPDAARRPLLSSQVDSKMAALSHRVDIYSYPQLCIFLRLFSTFGLFTMWLHFL